MATITITPGNSFTATETVTSTKLNDLGSPTAALTPASIGTADIADDAITPDKLSAGGPSWSAQILAIGGDGNAGGLEINPNLNGTGQAFVDFHSTSATNPDYDARILANSTGLQIINKYSDTVFSNGALEEERMRIDSDGNLLVGTTDQNPYANATAPGIAFSGSGSTQAGLIASARVDNSAAAFNRIGTDGSVVGFRKSGAKVGGISVTASATAYNTSSDYRLKEDITSIDNSIERLKQLKPCNFAWKSDGTRVDGFIAHEAQEVVPEAVIGNKDAVDEEGNPDYQGIDQSKLVPLLTKALQEAVSKIEALESRVATIES